ncbi:MAG TPA: hypothetical protein VJZ00_24100, partial [Thermoanaerobaculia bacterium]|nr:hypothetical protein [Thermoanaerobaculia bacterium]
MTAKSRVFSVCLLLVAAMPALATTFIMPTDDEMVSRSKRIVIGTAQSSFVRERDGNVETVYVFAIEQTLKGSGTDGDTIEIVSPGGDLGRRGVIVQSAAHFAMGEKALLFLNESHGNWTPTDLTLGKFRFVTSNKGDRLLTRDMDDVTAWERNGAPHYEKVRREEAFLHFIHDRVAGREVKKDEQNYLVDPSTVVLVPVDRTRRVKADTTYSAGSYTSNVTCPPPFCVPQVGPYPSRWPDFDTAGGTVTFHKKNDQNISGAGDGGVSTIQSGLAAWTNDCGSKVNIVYGGTTTTASADFDSV